jgi:leucyl/phenylalanyl-tRNA---protein transferase
MQQGRLRREMTLPTEPPPSQWRLPDPATANEYGIVGVGGDLDPGTILAAYRAGMFPMPLGRKALMRWWSPDPRAVIPMDGLRVSKSLRASCRRFEVRVDTAFAEVVDACADPSRAEAWITTRVRDAYVELHRLGWAHSVEAWTPDGELVGGLYGVAIGGLWAGESMFHRRTDASKVALVALVDMLREAGATLHDVQWLTPHLASLGAIDIPRDEYLRRLDEAVRRPNGPWPTMAP